MDRGSVRVAVAALSLMAPMLAAQDKPKDTKAVSVPESAMPPAGMCRLWLPDVPERQQPAPTDCATAIRTMPRDAMVLFGDLKRAAMQTTLDAAASAAAQRQASQRQVSQQGAREVRNFGGAARAGDPGAAQRAQGAQTTTAAVRQPGATTGPTPAGAAATKAALVKPPEKQQ